MNLVHTQWDQRYTDALRGYLAGATEENLEQAYDIGRQVVGAGAGLLDIAELHCRTLAALLPDVEPGRRCVETAAAAGAFLREGLGPFEMLLRGFREANDALRRLNETLEARVAERTQALEEANARLRMQGLVVEQLPVGVTVVRAETPGDVRTLRFLWVNRAGVEALGAPADELVGQRFSERFPTLVDSALGHACNEALASGVSRTVSFSFGDAAIATSVFEARPVRIAESELAILYENVTERERTKVRLAQQEQQLRRAQRLEALGRLAGGVAHDFNNLIQAIISYASFVLEAVPSGTDVADDVAAIDDAAKRAARLTSQLLAFSRQQVLKTRVFDVRDAVQEMEKLLRQLAGEGVRIEIDLADSQCRVEMDPTGFEQVLVNLVVNARDAMPGGGDLTVSVDRLHPPDGNAMVVVRVSDTGIGIPESVRATIFEPFFTTKTPGKGTGLGLATVFGIVTQTGGNIEVDSEEGRGTTFSVQLPLTDQHLSSVPIHSLAPATRRGTETILVVEDDETVRRACSRILRRAGYRVVEAQGPAEAILLAETRSLEFDLLFTDVVMPLMSGPELAARLERLRPGTRALYSTGYARPEQIEALPPRDVLRKPYRPAELLVHVRDALDRRESSR